MKRLISLAMCLTFFGALLLPLQSASAGNDDFYLPYECDYYFVWAAVEYHDYNLIWADGGKTNGTTDNDVIIGTYGDDDINGRSGNDIICGVGADDYDVLRGGSGNDIIIASDDGEDDLYGQTGNDTFIMYEGAWSCIGGSGNDTVVDDGYGCEGRVRSIEDWEDWDDYFGW